MRRPDALGDGCDLACGVKVEHHGVGDEPGRDRRDEGGERRRKRLDAVFGQDQGRDHGAF